MSATAADDGDLGGMRMEEEVEDEDEVEEEEDSADPEPFYDESEIFFERIGFNQMFGPQTGGCPLQHTQFNQETCASSQMPTLPSEVVPRVQVGQELGQQMGMQIEVGDSSAARSVSIIQSLLAKQKSSLSAVEYRTAFQALDTQDLSYMDVPTDDEWKMVDLLCKIFKPFYDATNEVSGSLYPTAHLYFHALWKVKEKMEKEASNEDHSIAEMAVKMKEKFQKYWDLSFLQICVPVVLDPRFKFNFVAFRLASGFGTKGPTYSAKVKSTVNDLFSAYASQTPDSNSNIQTQPNSEIVDEDNDWADWEQHLTAQKRSSVKNELEVYLQDDLFPRQKNLDILQWWMMHSTKYPVLSRMARDVLAAPASTVASESAFSTGGRVISDYRSRLTSKNVEALICLQDWLRGEGHTNFKLSEDDICDDEDQ